MGLLDYIGRTGYGGLLDSLMYQSPLLTPQAPAAGPQYDQMGQVISGAPQTDADPFGPIPGGFLQRFTPQNAPSVFNGAVQAMPIAGMPASAATPPARPPVAEPAAPIDPPPQRTINIGGYAMPQIGNASDYTPRQNAMASADQPVTDISAQGRPRTMPSFLGPSDPSTGDRLMAGVQNFTNAGGLIPALVGGISGFATGQRTDKAGIAQQNLRAQYDALAPIVGPQKALLAVMNPEAGKTILAQALEKQAPEWKVVGKDADGKEVYGFVDARNRKIEEYKPAGSEAPQTTVAGPDGKPIPIPPGVDRKTFVNEVSRANAKAAAGEKTEVQAKNEKFGNQMELAQRQMARLQNEGTSLFGQIASGVPLGNYAQSPEYRSYTQYKNSFITALLRDESGAAIGSQEFVRRDKEMFPQPGDDAATIRQKAELRNAAIEGMKKGAGPGYKSPSASTFVRRYNPETGRIE